jgi:HAD superfamily phosphoserine phosphatase-like hydrolase
MYEYCREEGFPVAIVTNGLDFYVQALLEAQGLTDVPFYAVHARFLGREIRYEYPYAREGCSDFGNCKCVVLDKYRKQGYSIVYVGDGRSDFCAAANADLVFAHRDLVRFCETYGISWMPFSDFADVLNVVREISGGKR